MKIVHYSIIGYNFNVVIGILFNKFEVHRLALILLVQLLFLVAIGLLEYQKRQDVISAFTPTFIGVIFLVLSFLIGMYI